MRNPTPHSPLRGLALAAALTAGTGAQAADQTFSSEASFLAAVPGLTMESFETLDGTPLGTAPVVTPLVSLSVSLPGLAVQTSPNTPQPGFDTTASDGSHYVLVYAPGTTPGTLTFTFSRPVTAFGFTSSDIGDSAVRAGALRLTTNAGTYASGVAVLSLPDVLPSGATQFIGLSQSQPFTQVQLTFSGFDEAYGADGIYLAAAAVPEPESWALLAAGLVGVALQSRRKASRNA
ncbi:PEP-CTERM sorting domain-containing protein [Roseateles sp. DXS20W]|uniref:PEP-CTERM sorting domain-containing protein n=1 Tax=Pelomonas lactea TaxID=3299030 RepID=A0ABW7GNA6_9BURK